MANVIIKSEERRACEERILRSYGADASNKSAREAAEVISARSNEAYQAMKKMEGNKR